MDNLNVAGVLFCRRRECLGVKRVEKVVFYLKKIFFPKEEPK